MYPLLKATIKMITFNKLLVTLKLCIYKYKIPTIL